MKKDKRKRTRLARRGRDMIFFRGGGVRTCFAGMMYLSTLLFLSSFDWRGCALGEFFGGQCAVRGWSGGLSVCGCSGGLCVCVEGVCGGGFLFLAGFVVGGGGGGVEPG